MKFFSFAVIYVLLAFALLPGWQWYTSYEGNYKVFVPQPLEHTTQIISSAIGEVEYHVDYCRQDQSQDNWMYMVSYCDYPPETVHSDSTDLLEEFFDSTIEAAEASVNGALIYAEPIEWEGHPGRFWRIEYRNGEAVIKTKAFVVGHRYYALQTIADKEKSLNPATNRFMDSFSLLGANR